ncbi:Cysteine proteinase inhibitor 8 [Zea mays]|jgi:hypothetical protein|uniref:Cysteine proteinase inhibitor 5 n=2 Tax=Zea mays TaxID=4577 RepID=Q4FZ48_MAIZE|nr:cysteine proteinase inhibitor 8 [Zea mays]AQK49622.1 Cysteine proteinase inhibitor 5 [Zea mays]PWZ25603.1 Cysteine proteinase inhibitor 8 [Zea mays]CAG29028.1 TPA: putative cystatin [Zea mays]|eukprot:XP_020407395.1 cysteine proteinase inhibitor 8 [Zea mays]
MAFLSTNALMSVPITAAAAPRHRRSLVVVRAAAVKSNEHLQEEQASVADGARGRRRAMVLLAATAAVTGSSVAICRSARAAGVTTLSGQYVKIENVKDPYVQGVGEWAVKEHNRQTGESLQFAEVVSGMEQVVAGTNYKLNLATKDPTSSYQAVVFDPLPNSSKNRQLMSFKSI